jgi:cytochrome c553
MLPSPPRLSQSVLPWEPEEIFWIVKNGLKFTGMPGWPVPHREDEVWDVTAFLHALPGMEPSEYRDLAGLLLEPPAGAPRTAAVCARCHDAAGSGRGGTAPRIAGQRPAYLYCALEAYSKGYRHSGIMGNVASALSEIEMRELALHYGGLPPAPPAEIADLESLTAGREIALEGIPSLKVPSCADCHGPAGRPRRPAYPSLAGQDQRYLELQLELFRRRARGGSPFVRLMHPVADRLERHHIEPLARYYASLAVESGAATEFAGWEACSIQ